VYIDALDGAALREKGQYDQAVAAYEHAQRLLGGQPLYGLAITYARMGRHEEARRVMRDLEAYARRAYVIPDALALGYAGIGDRDRAFAWLERAYEARSLPLLGLRAFPDYDSLRTDPRYDALVRKIGYP
jgi:tetratricopeptide (TPR) repeat protein